MLKKWALKQVINVVMCIFQQQTSTLHVLVFIIRYER